MTASLLGVGGAHIDRRGQVSGAYVPSASNPGTLREEVGGGTLNALRAAVQFGIRASLFSLRGGDAAGAAVAEAVEQSGLTDLSVTFLDRATPSYTALLDRQGDLIAALADMGLYDVAFDKQFRRASFRAAVAGHDMVLCDANLSAAALARLADLSAERPLLAIAISPAKAVRLRPILPALSLLFLNTREAQALAGGVDMDPAGLVAALRAAGLRRGVVTGGGAPTLAFDETAAVTFAPPAPARIVDVTGAGDALAGAVAAQLACGLSFHAALRHGLAAAALTVAQAAAAPVFDKADFDAMLARVPEPTDL